MFRCILCFPLTQVYHNDIPEDNVDWHAAALNILEQNRGIKLTPEQRERVAFTQRANTKDLLLNSGLLASALGGRDKLKKSLEGL